MPRLPVAPPAVHPFRCVPLRPAACGAVPVSAVPSFCARGPSTLTRIRPLAGLGDRSGEEAR